jgi:hypothetical protein
MKKITIAIIALLSIYNSVEALDKMYYSPEYGIADPLLIEKAESSNYLVEGSKKKFIPSKIIDGQLKTAWCVKGGVGEWIKITFKKDQPYLWKGKPNVFRILISNGFQYNDGILKSNNRIKKIIIYFDNGDSLIRELKDMVYGPQVLIINEKSRWVKIVIIEVYRGSKYNDTCISEIFVEHATHPDELTKREKKNMGYD